MFEGEDYFSDNSRGNISYHVGESNGKPLFYFPRKTTQIENKLLDGVVLVDGLLRLDNIQHTTEEKLKVFQNTVV